MEGLTVTLVTVTESPVSIGQAAKAREKLIRAKDIANLLNFCWGGGGRGNAIFSILRLVPFFHLYAEMR
jgi:hypothetical protein